MADRYRLVSIEEFPSHLILEILTRGRLSAIYLVYLELTSKTFGGSHGVYPQKFKSLVNFAAFQLCVSHTVYKDMGKNSQKQLFDRCEGNWKRILRFLQAVEESSGMVETSAGNMQITTGRYHTLLISNSSVYSCGSSLCGVLGHGPETTQCVAFTQIWFPSLARVNQVSVSHNHAAFVSESGEDKARTWFKSLQPCSITTWNQMAETFLMKYFPRSKVVQLKNEISRFSQSDEESFQQAWERFKELLRKVPNHGLPLWMQMQIFYNGITNEHKF